VTAPIPPEPAPASDRDGASAEVLVEERPGVLRGGATLTLQTRQALRLVTGRAYSAQKPAIIGLFAFANLLRPIWHGARADDPYADWWMLKVHDALESARLQLDAAQQEVVAYLQTLEAIEVALPTSLQPVRVELNFSNPYAFRGARLVSAYDGLVRATLSARHVGLVTSDEAERVLREGGRPIRRAFLSPLGYRSTGVTRQDLEEGTAKAGQAQDVMGEVPHEVYTGACRAPHAPSSVVPMSAAGAEHLELQPLQDLR
jgi:integrating conjugative element protein (TIGR03761 family)